MVATSAEQCRITSPGQRRKLHSTQCARLNAEALDAAVERWMAPIAAQEGELVANLARRQQDVVRRWRAPARTPRSQNGCTSASKPSKATCANGSCAWGHETARNWQRFINAAGRRATTGCRGGDERRRMHACANTEILIRPSAPGARLFQVGTRLPALARECLSSKN